MAVRGNLGGIASSAQAMFLLEQRRRASQKICVARRSAGHAYGMEPGIRPGTNPDPFTLRAKPELLSVLRHLGLNLLAYDGAPCSEAVGPLSETALRIEAGPGLRPGLRPVGLEDNIGTGVAEGLHWAAERCADRLPGVTLRVRILEAHGSGAFT